MNQNLTLIATGIVFNLFWLVSVFGQSQYIWLSVLMLLTSWWFVPGGFQWALLLALPGILMDALLVYFGVYAFAETTFYPQSGLPVWLMVLWLGFSTFLWCIRKLILARTPFLIAALGGLAGAASYLAGERLGAVMLPLGLLKSAVIIVICWTLFSMLALWWLKRIDKTIYRDVNP